jgi:signal peptidase I
MWSSYYNSEFIIVDRLSYNISEPKRWDVIVFKPYVSDEKEYFLKRIIGLPWETLKIENKEVYIKNDFLKEFKKLDEKYLNADNYWNTTISWDITKREFVIPDWEYFVMWDNRNHSTDSRNCFSDCNKVNHFIKKSSITWKVFLDFWYFNFSSFSFYHPDFKIETKPRWFSSPSTYNYSL